MVTVIVCERHGAQHDCINDRAGVACELWLPGDGPTGDGDADLEAAVYAIESTAHVELDEDQGAAFDDEPTLTGAAMWLQVCGCGHHMLVHDVEDFDGSNPMCCIDGCDQRGCADFFRDGAPSDTPPCPFSLSPIPIRADGGR